VIDIAGCAVITLLATALMSDYTGIGPGDFAFHAATNSRQRKNPPA
jgi:hypothetical protein